MDLRRSQPTATLTVVAEPRAKAAYTLCRDVTQVIPFDFPESNSPSDWANLLGLIRDQYYDAVISVRPSWAIGLLLWLTGTPVRISYAGGSKLFFTTTVPMPTATYQGDRYHALVQGLGITTATPTPQVTVDKASLDWAKTVQADQGLTDGYVLVYGGSVWLETAEPYPLDAWIKILSDFQQRQPDLPRVWLSDGKDQAQIDRLIRSGVAMRVVKPTSLGQVAAIVAGANLLICPDSVPLQLGVALDVFTLGLFGSTDPAQKLPDRDQFVGLKADSGQLADLDPDQVMQKVWGG